MSFASICLATIFFCMIFSFFVYGGCTTYRKPTLTTLTAIQKIPWTNQSRNSFSFTLAAPNISTWYLTTEQLSTGIYAYPSKTVILLNSKIIFLIDSGLENIPGANGSTTKPSFTVRTLQKTYFYINEKNYWQLDANQSYLFQFIGLFNLGFWDIQLLPLSTIEQCASYAEQSMN